MPRFKDVVNKALLSMGESPVDALKATRGAEVRGMWEDLMRHNHDEIILEHTNNVFIVNPDAAERRAEQAQQGGDQPPARSRRHHDDGKDASATGRGKQLIVYVDDSIVSAELNARRELIKLQFLDHYGEAIDEFKIIISRGEFKKHHPFAAEEAPAYREDVPSIPLDEEERAALCEEVEAIDDPRLRESLLRAMVADKEWKKGVERKRGNDAPTD